MSFVYGLSSSQSQRTELLQTQALYVSVAVALVSFIQPILFLVSSTLFFNIHIKIRAIDQIDTYCQYVSSQNALCIISKWYVSVEGVVLSPDPIPFSTLP